MRNLQGKTGNRILNLASEKQIVPQGAIFDFPDLGAISMTIFQADETGRRQLPSDPMPRPGGDESGPSKPSVKRPDSKNILDRMKRVDPEQAKRYRQRSGE